MQPRSAPAGSTSRSGEDDPASPLHTVEFGLDGFAWTALSNEAEREGLTVEELVSFAVLYYLADVDSGRVSRNISLSPRADPAVSPGEEPPDPAAKD